MKYFLLFIATFLSCSATVFAQTDSTKIQYSEETAATSDFKLKETYNYLIRAQVEEKTLLKIGVYGFGISGSRGSGAGIDQGYLTYGLGVERKIKPAFSVLADFQHTLAYNKPVHPGSYAFSVGARYYYNINARIRKGKSANNFSANYLGIHQKNVLFEANEHYHYGSSVTVLYGLQRRIGKYGFVDFGVGPALHHSSRATNLDLVNLLFSIGLAF